MAESTIRLLLVDDQQLMREGLRTILEMEAGIQVVGEAGNGTEAVAAFGRLLPDVVLMDIRMPGSSGIEATRRIRAEHQDAKILMLTTFDEDELVLDAVRAGASGYLLKDLSGEELAAAVRWVVQGGAALEPTVARKVMDALSRLAAPAARRGGRLIEPLTVRERAVLERAAIGLSNKEIAAQLFIAEGTVKNYMSAILQKLDARDRIQAVLRARELGLLEPEG